jgi:queuosine precursor transporter
VDVDAMTTIERRRRHEGLVFLALFALTIPAANWLIGHVGTVCQPAGPCLIPVAPGLMAPSGVIMAGAALVLRDLVQRRLGMAASSLAILAGAVLSALLAPPALVIASAAAFLLSEFADLAVYTPLARRGLIIAVVASGMVGLVVDSVVFLWLAFGSLEFLIGQIVGKAWMVLFSIPCVGWLRRRDARLGIAAV